MLLSSIPAAVMPQTEKKVFSALNEPFVDLFDFSGGKILVDMKYYKAKRCGAINTAFVRLSVAEKLMKASALLPDGYSFKIYDAWRPYDVQKDIYDEYFNKLCADEENKGKSEDELHSIAKTFVSFPDRSAQFAYVHSSGGAVDLTIVDGSGKELDMGCGFDDFSPLAYTHSFESSDNNIVKNNRRLLYHVMTKSGFTNYPSEWWHYDFGDIFWSAFTENSKIYPSVYSYNDILRSKYD